MNKLLTYLAFNILGQMFLFSGVAQSAIISVSDFNANESLSSILLDSSDISSTTTITASATPSTSPLESYQDNTFTITGLTLDGIGAGDDSVSFVIRVNALQVSADTSVPSLSVINENRYVAADAGGPYWGNREFSTSGNSVTRAVNATDGLRFTYESGSVTLGSGASQIYSLDFNGFDAADYYVSLDSGRPTKAVIELDDVVSTMPSLQAAGEIGSPNPQTISLNQSQEVTFGVEDGLYYIQTLDFKLEVGSSAVPEPSAFAFIIGVIGCGLAVCRRKRVRG